MTAESCLHGVPGSVPVVRLPVQIPLGVDCTASVAMALPCMPRSEELVGKRIGLFGLSADPPTGLGGHLGLVQRLAQTGSFDEIWVLPVFRHAFAEKSRQAPFAHRLAMCELTFASDEGRVRVRVLPLEKELAERAGLSAQIGTVDTVAAVLSSLHGVQSSLVLGLDTARDLLAGRWRRGEELLGSLHQLHVLHRPCSSSSREAESALRELPLHPMCAQKLVFHSGSVGDASSSAVRAYPPPLAELLSPFPCSHSTHPLVRRGLLRAETLAYISDHALYFYERRTRLRLVAAGAVGALFAIVWLLKTL